jgi:hypothetical protein
MGSRPGIAALEEDVVEKTGLGSGLCFVEFVDVNPALTAEPRFADFFREILIEPNALYLALGASRR